MSIEQIIEKLVGNINPVGETNTDEVRFENLITMCGVVQELIGKIEDVAKEKDRYEYSIKKAGNYAHDFLCELKNYSPNPEV